MAGKFVQTLQFLEIRSKAAAAKTYKIVIVGDDKITIKFARFHHNQRHFIMADNPTIIEQISDAEYEQLSAKHLPIAIKVGDSIKFIDYVNNFTIQFLEREQIAYSIIAADDIEINNSCVYTIAQLEGATGVQLSKTVMGADIRRYVVRDDSKFMTYINAGWSIHEIIDGSKPNSFILDIDLKREKNGYLQRALSGYDFIRGDRCEESENGNDFIETIKGIANMVINRYCPQSSETDEYAEYGYETDAKISRHIIYTGVICENGKTNKFIIKEIAEEMKKVISDAFEYKREEYGPDGEDYEGNEEYLIKAVTSIIDPVGSNGFWHMRFPGCSKNGDFARTIKPLNKTCSKYGQFMGIRRPFSTPNTSHPDCEKADNIVTFNTDSCTRSLDLLNKYYPGTFKYSGAGRLTKVGNFMCPTCDREHSSNGAFITTFRGFTKVVCFRNFQQTKQYNCIIRANKLYCGELEYKNADGNKIIVNQANDDFNTLVGATEVNGERCTDVIEDDFNSSYIISAIWGTGKSYFIARAIENAKARGLKIICVSSRISLSFQQVNNWGLTNYSDIKGYLDINKPEHYATNWQIEALANRVNPDNCAGALIVVDEITALAQHCASEGGESNNVGFMRRIGLNILAHLINNCARYIISDNDINNIQVNALIKANAGISPRTFINIYSKYENRDARIYSHKNATQLADNAINERIKINYENYKAGRRVFPICISHHHRKSVLAIVDKFKKYADPEHYNLIADYTRDTTEEVKRADYSNATIAWAGKIAVIYSPTISIGISAEIPEICEVFGVFDGSLITAQQSAQSLMRCRQATVFHIYLNSYSNPLNLSGIKMYSANGDTYTNGGQCEQGDTSDNFPDTMEEYLNWVDRSKVPRDIGYNYMHYFNPFKSREEAEKYLMGTFVGSLFVSAKLQIYRSKNNFYRELVAILNRAKFNIINADITINAVSYLTTDERGEINGRDYHDAKTSIKIISAVSEISKKQNNKKIRESVITILKAGDIPKDGTPEYSEYKDMLFKISYLGISFMEYSKMDVDDVTELLKYYDDIKNANKMLGSCKYAKSGNKTNANNINALVKTDAEIYPNIEAILFDIGLRDLTKFYGSVGTFAAPIADVTEYIENSEHITYFMDNNKRLFGRKTEAKSKFDYARQLFERVGIKMNVDGKRKHKDKSENYIFSFADGIKNISGFDKVKIIRTSEDA